MSIVFLYDTTIKNRHSNRVMSCIWGNMTHDKTDTTPRIDSAGNPAFLHRHPLEMKSSF